MTPHDSFAPLRLPEFRYLIASLLGVSFAGVPFIAGCDTVEHSKSTEVKDDGTKVEKESKTTKNPDGSVADYLSYLGGSLSGLTDPDEMVAGFGLTDRAICM